MLDWTTALPSPPVFTKRPGRKSRPLSKPSEKSVSAGAFARADYRDEEDGQQEHHVPTEPEQPSTSALAHASRTLVAARRTRSSSLISAYDEQSRPLPIQQR
jgi:hypothetical protein